MKGRALMAAPFAVGAVALVVLPAVGTLALSFFRYDGLRPAEWAGLANVARLARDPLLPEVLGATLMVIAIAVPLRIGGALGAALLLRRPGRGTGIARTIVYLPTIVPSIAYALVWLWILNPVEGPVTVALDAVGLPSPAWLTEANQARVGLGLMAAFQLGEGFIVFLAARAEIPPSLYEVAATEGAGSWQSFRWVTLPVMAPVLVLLVARDAVLLLSESFVGALVLTGGGPGGATALLPLHIFRSAFGAPGFGYAAVLSVLAFVLAAVVIAVQVRVVRGTGVLLD